MRKVLCTNCWRLLSLHGRNKHTIIIYQCQISIRTNHDVIWLNITMSKWLRAKPRCHFTEAIAKHSHSIIVLIVCSNVTFHCFTINPIHQKDRELVFLTTAIYENFFFQVLHRSNIRGIYELQLICNLAISLSSTFLFFCKTLQSIAFSSLFIFHFKHDGKGATATIWFTMIIKHWYQMSQPVKITTCILYSSNIF